MVDDAAAVSSTADLARRLVIRGLDGQKNELLGAIQRVPAASDQGREIRLRLRESLTLAVDVSGGKIRARIPPNPGERTNRMVVTEDESAAEVLFLYPDGTLDLRSSARDKADVDRKDREEKFNKWVEDTKKQLPVGGGTTPKGKDDF